MALLLKRKIILACIFTFFGMLVAAPNALAARTADGKFLWKMATLAPRGIGPSKIAEELIYPQLEKACDGAVKVKVYWGGVMGDDEDLIKKIRIGQLHGAALSSQGTIQACPEFSVVELPFLFNNYKEVGYVRSKMNTTFEALFEKYGFKLVNWIDQDFDQIFALDRPIAKLADFKNLRFGTAHGKMEDLMLKTLGADTIHLNVPEAPTAIRQGVVNAGIGPNFYLMGTQLYTLVKYLTPINIRYSPAVTILGQASWDEIPKQCKENLDANNEIGTKILCALMQESNKKFLAALIKYGIKEVKMTPGNYNQLKSKAISIYEELEGEVYPKALLDEIQAHLKVFRASPDSPSIPAVPNPDQDLVIGPKETVEYLVKEARRIEAEKDAKKALEKANCPPAK